MTGSDSVREKIAVIAIHGVGEHLSGATAASLARQLQTICHEHYEPFETMPLSIAVDGRKLRPDEPHVAPMQAAKHGRTIKDGFGSAFEQRYARRRPDVEPRSGRAGATDQPRKLDIEFSESLLAGGGNYKAIYETSVLKGTRRDHHAARDVDIYELFWSDLSHPGPGAWPVFSQLVQLLVHIASLGRTTAAALVVLLGTEPRWQAFYRLNAAYYWLLSTPIVVGNVLLALLALLLVPAMVPPEWLDGGVALLAGSMVAVAVGWALYRWQAKVVNAGRPAALASILIAVLAGVAVALACWLAAPPPMFGAMAFAGLETPLLFLLGNSVMKRYDTTRPGALRVWWLFCAAFAIWGAGVAWWTLHHPMPVASCCESAALVLPALGHTVEPLFALLVVFWLSFYACCLGALILGWFLKHSATSADFDRAALRRSIDTTILTACLPAPFFLTLVLCLWGVAYTIFQKWIPLSPFDPWLIGRGKVQLAPAYIASLIDISSNPLFLTYIAVLLLAFVVLVAALLPSVFAELIPPRGEAAASGSPALGNWLDGGFGAFAWAAALAAFGFFLVLPIGSIIALCHVPLPEGLRSVTSSKTLLEDIGLVVGGTSVGFIATTRLFAASFSSAFGKLRVLVDTAIDVDNWLRERPEGETPRLKIFARFEALLGYLETQGYSAVVIAAHSQGTVVATDFFRYRVSLRIASAWPSRLSLLTAGCPLRQLYALRFPTLYSWVHRPPTGTGPIGPSPKKCGVDRWVNAYGSGDYVGRYLWLADDSDRRWTEDGRDPALPLATPHEFCTGAAAHTHYFDANNALVGKWLDALIGYG